MPIDNPYYSAAVPGDFEIADQVKVHVTTVSRAVDDKWVQTPRGVFPLKRFFGGGTTNKTTGENVAWETIKQRLLEMDGVNLKFTDAALEAIARAAQKNKAGARGLRAVLDEGDAVPPADVEHPVHVGDAARGASTW